MSRIRRGIERSRNGSLVWAAAGSRAITWSRPVRRQSERAHGSQTFAISSRALNKPRCRFFNFLPGKPNDSGSAARVQRTLVYDDFGRLKSMTHANNGAAQPALDQTFAYDGLGRLSQATLGGSATSYGYGWDMGSNRITARSTERATRRRSQPQATGRRSPATRRAARHCSTT